MDVRHFPAELVPLPYTNRTWACGLTSESGEDEMNAMPRDEYLVQDREPIALP